MTEPMTGKDLILYILQNNLENAPVFDDGRFLNFMTVEEAAVLFGVGKSTVTVWVEQGYLPYIRLGEAVYIPAGVKDPVTEQLRRCTCF